VEDRILHPLFYPVDVVHPVSLVQPNKQDKPNNSLFPLAGFFSILLMGFGALDRGNLRQYQGSRGID
jgi:hypothetical protein